jgi:hypothetical protein
MLNREARNTIMSKEWWEESSQEFAKGSSSKPSEQGKLVNLGQHSAVFDDASGALTLFGTESRLMLSPDETYNLFVWLNDNYRDRLYQQAHQEFNEQGESEA